MGIVTLSHHLFIVNETIMMRETLEELDKEYAEWVVVINLLSVIAAACCCVALVVEIVCRRMITPAIAKED